LLLYLMLDGKPQAKKTAPDPATTDPPDDVPAAASRKKRTQVQAFESIAVVNSSTESSDDSESEDSKASNGTLRATDDASNAWTLPARDYWEPQSRQYQHFKADFPEASHQLTQQEVNAKYSSQARQALGRLEVIKKAMQFFGDTEFMKKKEASRSSSKKPQRERYDAEFTQQMYLDFAAVTDSNRPIKVDTKSAKRNDLVSVSVSSYQIPAGMRLPVLLRDPTARKKLSPMVRSVMVLKSWLMESCRPDIADWVGATLHGTKVQRIGGANVGADAFSLACSGKMERDLAFVSILQGHVTNVFTPMGPPSVSKQMKPKSERELLEGKQRAL
jgi:hypothetical protein